MSDKNIKAILGPMRLPFLVLNPVCVLLGIATAHWTGYAINFLYAILVFIGAIFAHISVNAINEYDDFKTGLDFKTEKTPFSGGSGTLPDHPEMAGSALTTGIIALVITALIGVYFLFVRGIWLLPLGLLGLVIIVTYTRLLTKNPLVCLVAPGIGFGPLMVMGTHFALTGSYSITSFVASLVPFFLVSDLLLLNQFPDLEADREIGRNHLVIVHGRKTGAKVYGIFLTGAFLSIIIGYVSGTLPIGALLALVMLVLAVPNFRGVIRNAENVPGLMPYMGKNVVLNILTPIILAIGLFIS